jgi:hypothetical protein
VLTDKVLSDGVKSIGAVSKGSGDVAHYSDLGRASTLESGYRSRLSGESRCY